MGLRGWSVGGMKKMNPAIPEGSVSKFPQPPKAPGREGVEGKKD